MAETPPESGHVAHAAPITSEVELTPRSEKTIVEATADAGASLGGRTASGGFPTAEGTLYVSKPYTSRSSKRRKAVVTFVPRKSAFDTTNELSGANEFRGFFTLFWISLFLFTVRTYIQSFEAHGHALNLAFATSFSQDAITLALSDAALVLSTGICVPFAKVISKGWIKYYWTGVILQHIWQTLVLLLAVTWTFNRQWPWVQSGYLTLHSLVMIMKVHSYMTVNGYLSNVSSQAEFALSYLRQATSRVGGWDQAILEAKSRRFQLDREEQEAQGHSDYSGHSTPELPTSPGVQKSFVDASAADTLRRRLVAASAEKHKSDPDAPSSVTAPASDTESPVVVTEESKKIGQRTKPGPHPLVDHPDERIATLAREYYDSEAELWSNGPECLRWPENITFKNFATYQLVPSLVYELEYPRTDSIRPLYLFEKTVATFGSFALLYTITETFILPQTAKAPGQSFARSLLDLALPFMVSYLLLFYLIFECICNGFAELSYFADRQFYEDWYARTTLPWNSTSWDEFSRKWNKPVHSFLLRHVYAESSYRVSKSSAMFLTFLLSAAVHEMVMAIVTQKIRPYLFTLQLIQIPLIFLGRLPVIKRNKLLGNMVFWLGLYAGFPLLCVAYVQY